MHQNIEMKTQSRAFRTSDWAEGSPSNRTMNLNTQQEWLIDNSVNVLEWPNHSLSLTPIKFLEKPENVRLPPSNLTQNLILPSATCSWNNIVINQSDLKNTFMIFVKFRLTISVWCLYISVIHLLFPLILGIKVRFRCREMVKITFLD